MRTAPTHFCSSLWVAVVDQFQNSVEWTDDVPVGVPCLSLCLCLSQFLTLDRSFQCNAHHMLWFSGISPFVTIFFRSVFGKARHWWNLSALFSSSLSLFPQCHVSCVPVFNSMSRKEIKPWGLVVTLSMIICLFVYTGTGNTGALIKLSFPWVSHFFACERI